MDFRREELFSSVCAQGDDAGNDSGQVGQNDRHERTSWKMHPARPGAKSVKRFFIIL
jgi:hypothetical protein